MPTTLRFITAAIWLDWRLATAAIRHDAGNAGMFLLSSAFLLSVMAQSALDAAVVVGRVPSALGPLLLVYAWNTALAVIGVAHVAGVQSLTSRVAAHLLLQPASRMQTAMVLLSVAMAGRFAAVAAGVSLPLVILITNVLPTERAVFAVLLWLMIFVSVPACIRVCIAVVFRSRPLIVLGLAVGVAVSLMIPEARRAVSDALWMLPPNVLVGFCVGALSWFPAVLVALVWLGAVTAADAITAAWHSPRVALVTAKPLRPLPRWSRLAGRAGRVPPALLHGEVVRLLRNRHLGMGGLVGSGVALMVLSRFDPASGALTPMVVLVVLPVVITWALFLNLFGPDRAAIQAYYLTVPELASVLRAKQVTLAGCVVPAQAILVVLALDGHWAVSPAFWYVPVIALVCLAWAAAVGPVISVLFPTATDPHEAGKGRSNGPAAVVGTACMALMAAIVFGGALAFDTHRVGASFLLGLAAFAAVWAGMAIGLLPRVASRLLSARREQLANELGLSTTVF